MTTIFEYKPLQFANKKGRPRISKGTLFLEGYGISIKINNKKLVIRNGKEQEETWLEIRNGSYNLPQESYFNGLVLGDRADFDRIIIQGSGYITFDAMQWLTEWGISVIMIDKRGKLFGNFNQVSGNTEPLIRQKQYDCFRNENKLEYLRKWVVSHKVTNQIMILRDIQSFKAIEYMEKQLLELEYVHNLNDISEIESISATRYYIALSKYFLQINPKLDFKTRKNPMTGRHNDSNDIINSLLNYGFGILQSEIGKQLNGIGLDCNVGFYHRNHSSHSPLIWDMMEHFRYLIDKSVLLIANSKIEESEYHYERGNLEYPYSKLAVKNKRWLIMHKELTKRYVKILSEILEAKRYQKAHVGRNTEYRGQKFQEMREITIMKMRCLELRDYILERKKTLSQPQKILSR